ncbi:hypothetical protein NQ317_002790 [Molorchus minor]|uniref:Uncharacterized protein n=1 Tax=Molorchus minor TaxID=1323400 RepID=A0ABQ9J7D8_9CUCU|nr:hypothetical protein NQ317_002790 [Molorchus minor]
MFKGVSCTSNECLNKAIHWTSIKHVQCTKIYGYLVDIFYESMYAVLGCLRQSREASQVLISNDLNFDNTHGNPLQNPKFDDNPHNETCSARFATHSYHFKQAY